MLCHGHNYILVLVQQNIATHINAISCILNLVKPSCVLGNTTRYDTIETAYEYNACVHYAYSCHSTRTIVLSLRPYRVHTKDAATTDLYSVYKRGFCVM